MTTHGCHNKPGPTRSTTYLAQDGYEPAVSQGNGNYTRTPRYVLVPHVMTTECQYTRGTPDDPRCKGCTHRHQPQGEPA